MAFESMERALVLRRHFFGADSSEVSLACKALADMCNLLAMSFLQQGVTRVLARDWLPSCLMLVRCLDNYAVTIDLLKKAEVLTQHHHPAERATTLNNLACYYRRLGKLHAAMTSLTRALGIEKKLNNVRNAADTHLNLCAVLSQLGKHQEALGHAQSALLTLQDEFFQKQTNAEDSGASSPTRSAMQLDRVSVMCIAYHNMGVEQEFLKDLENCVTSYKKGVGLAEQYLGVDHAITTTIRNSYLAAKRTIAASPARKSVAMRGYGPNSLSNSSAKSPGRLLQSPRSAGSSCGGLNSLRMPTPLGKNKQQTPSGLPTPRSIIADTLSRSSPLPPLSAKSGVLSPEDPFFSPRFRFEEGGIVKKASKKPVRQPKATPEEAIALLPGTLSEEPEAVVVLPIEIPSTAPKAAAVVSPATQSSELEAITAPIVVESERVNLQAETRDKDRLDRDDQLQFGDVKQNGVQVPEVNSQSMYPSVWSQLRFGEQVMKPTEQSEKNSDQTKQTEEIEADQDTDILTTETLQEAEASGSSSLLMAKTIEKLQHSPPDNLMSGTESDSIAGDVSQRLDLQSQDEVQDLGRLVDNSEQARDPLDSVISDDGNESFMDVEAVMDLQTANDLGIESEHLSLDQEEGEDEVAQPVDVLGEDVPNEVRELNMIQSEEDVEANEFTAGHEVDHQESTTTYEYEDFQPREVYPDDHKDSGDANEMPPGENVASEYPAENAIEEPDLFVASTELLEQEAADHCVGNDYIAETAIEAVESPSEVELTPHDTNGVTTEAISWPEGDILQTVEVIESQSIQEADERFAITQYGNEKEVAASSEQTHVLELEIESPDAHADENSYNDFHDGDLMESAHETLEEQINRLPSAPHDDEMLATQEHGAQELSWGYEDVAHYETLAQDEGVDHEYARDNDDQEDQSQLSEHEPNSLQDRETSLIKAL